MANDYPVVDAVLRLALAFVLVLPLAWERERRSRSAGLRTFALLSMSVCGFLLLAQGMAGGAMAQADAFYGVLLGIGFVGSGAVVKSPDHPRGMATAVALWVTGAIGTGVAYGQTLVSAAVSLMCLVALRAPSLARLRKRPS
jgi:putative Mg2+ transporter-C (MgtC) family protein